MDTTITVGGHRIGLTVEFTAAGRFEPATMDYPGSEPYIEVEGVTFDDPSVIADLLRADVLDAIRDACLTGLRERPASWHDDDGYDEDRWAA